VKKILLHPIVRHKNVGKSIAIVVSECYAQSAAFFRGDARALADVRKSSIAIVVIENAGGGRKFFRRTIGMIVPAAIFIVFRVPVHVAGYKKIELPVVIVIQKSGGNRPSTRRDARFGRHIREGAVAVIVIQNIFSVTGDIEIGIAIVIVIADSYTHAIVSIAGVRQAGLLGYVGEGSVFILPVQAIPVARVVTLEVLWRSHRAADVPAIHEEDVQ
jgi:hypothetical protein